MAVATIRKIGIVAGETSGDYLAAGLIASLQERIEDIEFIGIGGPRMTALGMQALYPMDSISIMGLDGLFTKVKHILAIRSQLARLWPSTSAEIGVLSEPAADSTAEACRLR